MANNYDALKLGTLCSHPKVITTRDNRKMIVPCGKCLACLSQKANTNKRVLMSEFKSHKYCLFVTLTYNEENIPLMDLVKVEGFPYLYDCYSVSTGEYLMQTKITGLDLFKLKAKANHHGYLPYCENKDLQNYIKRLRKHLTKYSNEKIRYYAISEMGQVHYRPHFHILLFFDQRTTFCHIRQICNSCWSFGHVDTQLPKDQTASARYLAQYLNSTLSLPEIFKERKIRPRVFHSSRLGFNLDSILAKAIKEQDYIRIMRYGARRMDFEWSDDVFPKWRSLENYLFPKCKGYTLLSDVMRLRAYNLYPYIRTKYFHGKDVTCREMTSYIYNLLFTNKLTEYEINRLFIGQTYCETVAPTQENFMAALYCSRHFGMLCAWLCVSEQRLLSIIDGYYKFRDEYNLKNWYELLQELSTLEQYRFYTSGAGYSNLYTDEILEIDGIVFDTKELRNLLKNDSLHQFSQSVYLSMQQSALKHRQQNEYYIKNLQ